MDLAQQSPSPQALQPSLQGGAQRQHSSIGISNVSATCSPHSYCQPVECCSQVLPGAAMCQYYLLQMGREDQSSNEKRIRCSVCLHEDSFLLQVNLELHPQQCPLHT